MSNIKELTHALSIVQKKLNACQAQKAELLNKVKKKKKIKNKIIYPPSFPDVD